MKKGHDRNIAVIGLGTMGKKLAELLQDHFNVMVWNRTLSKAEQLADVQIAGSVEETFSHADVVVMCVYDYTAVTEVLNRIKDQSIFAGKTLINFTTGSPEEVSEIESLFTIYGGHYINGALQVAPDQMGFPDTTILVSGKEEVYKREEAVLKIFGGNLHYLGPSASLASAVDLATLSWLYGSYIGLIYGVELCIKKGVSLSVFGSILEGIVPGFTAFFKHQIDTIDRGDFTVQQSPMAISISASERIKTAFDKQGTPTQFWQSITDLFKQAEKRGLANQEVASIIKIIQR